MCICMIYVYNSAGVGMVQKNAAFSGKNHCLSMFRSGRWNFSEQRVFVFFKDVFETMQVETGVLCLLA